MPRKPKPKPFALVKIKRGSIEDGLVGRCRAKPHLDRLGVASLMFYVHDTPCTNCGQKHHEPFVLFFEDRNLFVPVASCSIPEFRQDFLITKGLN